MEELNMRSQKNNTLKGYEPTPANQMSLLQKLYYFAPKRDKNCCSH